MITKLHAILRPFLLRRMKIDVELMLPRKKEIILYATMTEHQKKFQEHLINKTLEKHLILEKGSHGMIFVYMNRRIAMCVQVRKFRSSLL